MAVKISDNDVFSAMLTQTGAWTTGEIVEAVLRGTGYRPRDFYGRVKTRLERLVMMGRVVKYQRTGPGPGSPDCYMRKDLIR